MDKPKFVVDRPDELTQWWEVLPARDSDGDYEAFDDYSDAIACVEQLAEMTVDQMEPCEVRTITIRFVKECTRQDFYDAFGFISEDVRIEPKPDNTPPSPPLDVIA